jgi:segregation and condensation protein A
VPYEVSTAVFEGPFDLLLHLITREQVDIYEVNLSRIVDAYVAEIQRMEGLDLEVATEFLLIAATLIELKLRRLLPEREGVELDEELGLLEERDLLLAKLLECKTFKEAAQVIEQLQNSAARSIPRTVGIDDRFLDLTPDPLAGVAPTALRKAFLAVLERSSAPPPVPGVRLDHVGSVRVTVSEILGELASVLPSRGRVTFREITEGLTEPFAVIVHFLAVLELYKQGWVDLDQPTNFGDLHVSWRPDGPDTFERDENFNEVTDVVDVVGADGAFADDEEDDADLDRVLDEAEFGSLRSHDSLDAAPAAARLGPSTDDVDAYEG